MTDPYRALATRLDELPNGFPATESGVELKILRKLFSPEEAEMAMQLKSAPETAEAAAARLGRPKEELRTALDRMAGKGLIGCFTMQNGQVYLLMPFVPGIYEFQLNRLDKEFVELFEEYEPHLMGALGGTPPAVTRVVPVNRSIQAEHQILRHEDVRGMVERAKSFVLRECICRKERALAGQPCTHTLETCLGFSNVENAFDTFVYAGRIITKEYALRVLEEAEKEGLVHCTYNIQEGHSFVCNCCCCCCPLLKGIKNHKTPHILTRSNFAAAIDQETCSQCGTCADERCMMEAIVQENGAYRVQAERCIGCGVCTVSCPTGAMSMERIPEAEQDTPPENLVVWSRERSSNRRKDSQ